MASNPHRDSAQALPDAVVTPEKECGCHDKSAPQDPLPPRAGRTGGQGTRAERPSEGSIRKADDKDKASPGRGAKAPSASGTPHSEERSSK